jgi:hypothetical protein
MEGTILRSEVYKAIHSGEPFDATWITCDRRRGTGGDIISAEGWMKLTSDEVENVAASVSADEATRIKKDPNHPKHGTVNVFNPANSGHHPITVHYDLITFFNGKRVIN